MDQEMLGLLFRGIERLIVVTAAFFAIWLGFRLFATVVSDTGAFEGSMGHWTIKLQRIAPGVFFACFGAIILMSSINSPLEYRTTKSNASDPLAAGPSQDDFRYVGGYSWTGDKIRARHLISDLTTATGFLSKPDVLDKIPLDDRLRLGEAIVRLTNHRSSLVDAAFGKGWQQKYQNYVQQFKTDEQARAALPEKEYKVFSDILASLRFGPSK